MRSHGGMFTGCIVDWSVLQKCVCGRAQGCGDVWVTSIMGVDAEEGVPCKAT